MGRTWPTFNDQLEREARAWKPFRDALRREDQRVFDKLFVYAKRHMAAGQNACRPVPFETLMVCAALELVKEVDRLKTHERRGDPAP